MNYQLIIYISISFLILILISKISYNLKLFDLPNKRKIHNKPVLYTGGLAISLIYIISIIFFDYLDQKLNLILSFAFFIGIVGFLDDKYDLSVGGKLSLQIFPIIYLIISENLNLGQIGDYNYFKLELNSFSIPFTLLAVLFLINSFNYIDGLDGVLSFTTISVLSILFFLISDEDIGRFLIIVSIPIFLFLCFNFELFKLPKLFLGDSGSLLLGFIISFTLIHLANQKIVHPILLAFSVSIFVYEFLSINLIRLKNNQNPFKARQDHLHHLLFRYNNSIFLTNSYISLMNIILFSIGYLGFILIGAIASLILFISLFLIYLYFRNKYHKRK